MRLPKGATSDGAVTLPDITVSSATSEAVNANSLKAYIRQAKQILTDGATVTWNVATSRNAQVTLGGNRTLSVTNAVDGDMGKLLVIQDATGSRTLTLPSGSYVPGQGATTTCWLKPVANSRTLLSFWFDGTNYYWTIVTY